MKRFLIIIALNFVLLIGCSNEFEKASYDMVENKFLTLIRDKLTGKEINYYIKSKPTILDVDESVYTNVTHYDFNIEVELSDEFLSKEDYEQYDLLLEMDNLGYMHNCGIGSTCFLEVIHFKIGDIMFSVYEPGLEFEIIHNKEVFYPEESRDFLNDMLKEIHKDSKRNIYEYMKNYLDESYDIMEVAEMAANYFNITPEEALGIYREILLRHY